MRTNEDILLNSVQTEALSWHGARHCRAQPITSHRAPLLSQARSQSFDFLQQKTAGWWKCFIIFQIFMWTTQKDSLFIYRFQNTLSFKGRLSVVGYHAIFASSERREWILPEEMGLKLQYIWLGFFFREITFCLKAWDCEVAYFSFSFR